MTEIFVFMVLLQIKHWYIDFVDQSMDEVKSKGNYGEWLGIGHSLKHGIGTAAAVVLSLSPLFLVEAVMLGLLDAVIHYHTDWAKMNYGNRDIQSPEFWNHLGLDQMIHQLTYIAILGIILL